MQTFFFFLSGFPEKLSGMQTQSELSLMQKKTHTKKTISFSYKMCGKYKKKIEKKVKKKNIRPKNMYSFLLLFDL